MNGNWFWRSSFAIWIEGKLISLTNWFWNKRHPAPAPKQRTATNTNEISKENTAKKRTTKKAPAKKKSDWSVKE